MSIQGSSQEREEAASRHCPACRVAQCNIRRQIAASFGDSVPADFEILFAERGQAVELTKGGTPELRFVVDGMIMVENSLPDGRRQVTGFRAHGDLLCFPSPVGEVGYAMTAVAPTRICRVRPTKCAEGRRLREGGAEVARRLGDRRRLSDAWSILAPRHLLTGELEAGAAVGAELHTLNRRSSYVQ